jgi:hypothetical protein
MIVINENCLQEQIKYRLNSGNACNDSDLYLLSSCLPSKWTQKLKFHVYVCGTRSLTFVWEHKIEDILKQGAVNSCT